MFYWRHATGIELVQRSQKTGGSLDHGTRGILLNRTKSFLTRKNGEQHDIFCTLLQLQATGSMLRTGTSLGAAHLQQEAAVTVALTAEALGLLVAVHVVPAGHEKVRHEALRNAK